MLELRPRVSVTQLTGISDLSLLVTFFLSFEFGLKLETLERAEKEEEEEEAGNPLPFPGSDVLAAKPSAGVRLTCSSTFHTRIV